jgi:Omp85 superfamily domain
MWCWLAASVSTWAAGPANASDDPATTVAKDEGALSLFPALFYTPETSMVMGAMAMYAFRLPGSDRGARRSGLPIFAAYTLKNQFIVATRPNVYFDGERWNAEGSFEASHFPDTVYPDGRDTKGSDGEKFTSRRVIFEPQLTRLVWRSLRVGARGTLRYMGLTETESGGIFETRMVSGALGGFRTGFGPVFVWDNRDNNFTTYRGGRHELSATVFSKSLGSTNDFSVIAFDTRQFFTLWREHVLGLQAFGQFAQGDVPFDLRGRLGGPSRFRGLFEGRFSDRNLLAVQMQYAFPVATWLRLAAFGGAGQVAHGLPDFDVGELVYSGGGGARIALNRKDRVNLRIDVAAASTGDVNFYVHMIEAF